MASAQTEKTLLHASATEGTKTVRWIVAAFANKTFAGSYAALLKQAHVAGNVAEIAKLDPNHAKDKDGKPLSPVKLSAAVVPYNPHATLGSGLDED